MHSCTLLSGADSNIQYNFHAKSAEQAAAGGGNRELVKGRNTENFDGVSLRKATIFLTVLQRENQGTNSFKTLGKSFCF